MLSSRPEGAKEAPLPCMRHIFETALSRGHLVKCDEAMIEAAATTSMSRRNGGCLNISRCLVCCQCRYEVVKPLPQGTFRFVVSGLSISFPMHQRTNTLGIAVLRLKRAVTVSRCLDRVMRYMKIAQPLPYGERGSDIPISLVPSRAVVKRFTT